eukprot:gene5985-4291_t
MESFCCIKFKLPNNRHQEITNCTTNHYNSSNSPANHNLSLEKYLLSSSNKPLLFSLLLHISSIFTSQKVQGDVIGVDLGTTYSCVATMDGDKARVLENVEGFRTTPSEFRKTSGIDLSKERMALQRVREAAEKAKCELSSAMETEVNLPFITANAEGAQHLQMHISRSKFESIAEKLIERSITRHAESDRLKRELVEVRNNAETQLNTAEKQLGEWKHVTDAEKENVRTLVAELRKVMENPNVSKDELSGATDKLQKAVMECGRTEYQQAAAANSGSSSGEQQQGEQQQQKGEQKPDEEKKN